MTQSKQQIRWSGLIAMLGGVLAVALTFPFAAAYERAYPGYGTPPFWLPAFLSAFGPLLNFAAPVAVYNLYGRIFEFVYLLILPGVVSLHALQRKDTDQFERWGFAILIASLVISFLGVAGDYWADGAGWGLELIGLLTLLIGTTLFGIATLRAGRVPKLRAWLLILAGPGAIAATLLIGHIPSGPTFLFAIAWIILGSVLWQDAARLHRRADDASVTADQRQTSY